MSPKTILALSLAGLALPGYAPRWIDDDRVMPTPEQDARSREALRRAEEKRARKAAARLKKP